jgi:hypothetical protein
MASASGDLALLEASQLLGIDSPWTMAERGDLDGLQRMASMNPAIDLDRPDLARGWTPLMYASSRNWSAVVEWLQSRGADAHRQLDDGTTCAYLAAVSGSVDVLKVLVECGCNLDIDVDELSSIETLCVPGQGAAMLYGSRLECACLLVLGGATVSAGYVSQDARRIMMPWALSELASHHAPVTIALGARHGRDVDGEPCILQCLDGRALQTIGAFLRRPRREVRRLERALWVWTSEARHETRMLRAAARGFSRADHCFTVF